MRGNTFPFVLATVFGIVNGIYIFKPMIIEARLKRLQEAGEDVNAVGNENRREEEVRLFNAKAKARMAGKVEGEGEGE
ncbi:hypothetical protein BDD12DRAFT_897990 [Trichophaea hybrida]|nr:hypothetical protein BDD12DRAFT_897990 [Trichophaea hybrida]